MHRYILPFILFTLVSCSSYTPPITPSNIAREVSLNLPAEAAWRAAIRYFSEHNIPIDNMDHSSLFIKTRPIDLAAIYAGPELGTRELPIRNQWCDCGSANLANVWSSESRINLSFNIVIESRGSSSTLLRVNTFFEGVKLGKQNAYASGYDIQMPLTCVSTGRLETEVAAFIRRVAAP